MVRVEWKARRGAATVKSTPGKSGGPAPLAHCHSNTCQGLVSDKTSQENRKVAEQRSLQAALAWEGRWRRLGTSVLQRVSVAKFGSSEHKGRTHRGLREAGHVIRWPKT